MLKEMTANPDIPDVEIKDELLTMVMAGVRSAGFSRRAGWGSSACTI